MSLTSSLAIYFIIWWLVLFAVLPFGNYSPHELGEESPGGNAPSAPKDPQIPRKCIITTVIATIAFCIVYFVLTSGIIGLEDMPFMDMLKPYS